MEDTKKICSCFGHREIQLTEKLYATTTAAIMRAIKQGCRVFFFGGFGEFDRLCYQIVTKLRQENPAWELQRVFCVTSEYYLRKKYHYFKNEDYEDVIYLTPSFTGWYKAIYYRNCAMIDNSAVVIFYAEERKDSGAYKAYKYAKKSKDKQIVNLWNEE